MTHIHWSNFDYYELIEYYNTVFKKMSCMSVRRSEK